jgi:hypothetical protein
LPDTDGGREVIYCVDPLKRAPDQHWIPNIPHNELNLRIEIPRSPPFRPMNLWHQYIEDADTVTKLQQLIG